MKKTMEYEKVCKMKEALPVFFLFCFFRNVGSVEVFSLNRSFFLVALFFFFLVFKSHERATQGSACTYNTIAPDPFTVSNVRKAYEKVVLKCNLT